ncbi:MAG: BrnA antitoxin family protein [Proteobacteria bacterium]|nr:BrnA antitoxin family protein [Pseudomonadota bacterium]
MTAKKPSTPATWTDPDDAPELTEAFFQAADQYEGATLKPRGRPIAATTKEPVKLRLDADVLAALRASGDGWQTRINDALRASLMLAGKLG